MPDFSFPAWMRDQNSFADSLLKGAQVGNMIAQSRYRNQALAAQAIQAEREYDLREKHLEKQTKLEELNYQMKSDLLKRQTDDQTKITAYIQLRNATPIEERQNLPYPSLSLPQSYGFVNQIVDNDRAAYEGMLARTTPKQYAPSNLMKMVNEGLITLEQAKALAPESILGPTEEIRSGTDEFGRPYTSITKGMGQKAGQEPGAPTTAFKTKLQEQLHGTEGTLELLNTMQQNMGASDFGLPGIARDLKVRLGPLLGMDVTDEDLTVRKTIPLLRAALYKELRSDSNITKAEQETITKALPNEGWLESRENVQQSLNVLMPWLKSRAIRNAEALGVTAPRSTWNAEQVRQAYEKGELTLEQARDTIRRFGIEIPKLPQDEGPAPMIENAR